MPKFIEAWGPDGIGLRVEFIERGDRVAHAIKLVGDIGPEKEFIWLTSVEGDPKEPWPASPPLQSLHIEERGAGQRVALSVGLAGKSHWSLSVEPIAGQAALCFDVACRVHAEPQWLGSRYLMSENRELSGKVEVSQGLIRQENNLLDIAPNPDSGDLKLPRTIRWIYVCRVTST